MSNRPCRYECGTTLGKYDTEQNKYLELDGTLHTRERCQQLKQNKLSQPQQQQTPQVVTQQQKEQIATNSILEKLEAIEIQNEQIIRALKDFGEAMGKMSFERANSIRKND